MTIACKNSVKKFAPLILALIVVASVSIFLSRHYVGTDFPSYYYVANTILDPNVKNEAIYSFIDNKYGIPEKEIRHQYSLRYSVLAACLLAPLALLPYYAAKSFMIFLDIAAYITGVAGRYFLYPLAISCLWAPFLNSIVHVQVNGILFLLVATAVLAVEKDRPFVSGVLIAIATLFKLFPMMIVIPLGVRDWRVLPVFTAAIAASFLIPGSMKWLYLLGTVNPVDVPKEFYTAAYQWLGSYSLLLFAVYSGTIGAVTLIIAYLSRDSDSFLLASFGISAAFVMMPVVEYHHLTFLVLPYIYLAFTGDIQGWRIKGILISTAILIGSSMSGPSNPIKYSILFLYWVFFASLLLFRHPSRTSWIPSQMKVMVTQTGQKTG
jgi:hypothetical protein